MSFQDWVFPCFKHQRSLQKSLCLVVNIHYSDIYNFTCARLILIIFCEVQVPWTLIDYRSFSIFQESDRKRHEHATTWTIYLDNETEMVQAVNLKYCSRICITLACRTVFLNIVYRYVHMLHTHIHIHINKNYCIVEKCINETSRSIHTLE